MHRPLKVAFEDPEYHPKWNVTEIGNKYVFKDTERFKQFGELYFIVIVYHFIHFNIDRAHVGKLVQK